MPDLRPRWQRWLAPPGRGHLVALSVAWFLLGLVGFIASVAAYGWRTAPIEHVGYALAWLVLSSWLVFGKRLHRR
ncbi:MAG TPA: hypothetical protein VFD36_16760 [Kofleriaceae bacterium]|nr:hypothetical protein [Kofleriaceae bacterium]